MSSVFGSGHFSRSLDTISSVFSVSINILKDFQNNECSVNFKDGGRIDEVNIEFIILYCKFKMTWFVKEITY